MLPSDWRVEDTEPWYHYGQAKIDGKDYMGEAEFNNKATKEVIVHIPGRPFDPMKPAERYIISESDFSASGFPQDNAMAALMRRALKKR